MSIVFKDLQVQQKYKISLDKAKSTYRIIRFLGFVIIAFGIAFGACNLLFQFTSLTWIFLGILVVGSMLASLNFQLFLPRCPVCGSSLTSRVEKFCPICGANSLIRPKWWCAASCGSCGNRLYQNRYGPMYKIRACTHCGTVLLQNGV